jgi:hypothetical protein
MNQYAIRFYKNLISSEGRPFKCLQSKIHIRAAKNIDRAVEAAKRRFERLRHVRDWKLHADTLELEVKGNIVGPDSNTALPGREPWSEEDLIALAQLHSVGIPTDHIAAYLSRTVAEVEEKAGLNGIKTGPHWPHARFRVLRRDGHQ